jgi:hypothetical protein
VALTCDPIACPTARYSKGGGEHFTPRDVIMRMIDLLLDAKTM